MATIPSTKAVNPGTNAVALVNAVRKSASADYRNSIDIAESFDDVKAIGATVMAYPGFQNEFLDCLVNKIASTYVMAKMFTNPLAMFKKGELNLGETVELIFNDIIKARQYNIETAENEVFKRGDANALTAYVSINSKIFYKATVEPNQLAHAFITETGFYALIENITAQLVNSASQDEFMAMKYLVVKQLLDGKFKVVEIPPVNKTNMDDIITAIKTVSNEIEFPSTGVNYNYAGVHTFSTKDDQYLIMSSAFDASMDVNALAAAFNMEKKEFLGHRVRIDSFGAIDVDRLNAMFAGVPGYEEPGEDVLTAMASVPAVLIDRDWFFILNQNLQNGVDTLQNPEGMYRNYWRHIWTAYNTNPFAIAVAFIPGAPTVNSITLSPSTLTVSNGQTAQLTVDVDTTNYAPTDVTFASDSEYVNVDYRGRIYVHSDAPASTTATITATSTFDTKKTGTATVKTPAGA
jgi:hypothetical protein